MNSVSSRRTFDGVPQRRDDLAAGERLAHPDAVRRAVRDEQPRGAAPRIVEGHSPTEVEVAVGRHCGQLLDSDDTDISQPEPVEDRRARLRNREHARRSRRRARPRARSRPGGAGAAADQAAAADRRREIRGRRERRPRRRADEARSSSSAIRLPQMLERARRARLDRPEPHAERGRRLLLGELEEEAARDHEALLLAQSR